MVAGWTYEVGERDIGGCVLHGGRVGDHKGDSYSLQEDTAMHRKNES